MVAVQVDDDREGYASVDRAQPEQHPLLRLKSRIVGDQRFAFLIVGGINTAAGLGYFAILDLTVGGYLDRATNQIVGSLIILAGAHVLSVVTAFVLYRRFVFKVRGHVWRDLARFESVYLVSLGINAVALPVLVQFGINRIVAQAIILVGTTIVSYVGHRYFSFRRPAAETVQVAALDDDVRPPE